MHPNFSLKPIERREALGLLAGVASVMGFSGARAQTGKGPSANGVCVLTTQTSDGPFYFDAKLLRSDIAEDHPGAPLALTFHVLDVRGCTPIEDARVDVWHADAEGLYSGYDRQFRGAASTAGKTFLRGAQVTDAKGQAQFRTIYPGWYWGRTVHIHYKVFLPKNRVVTSQLYFPETVNDRVYATRAPYASRKGRRDVTNATDFNLTLPPAAGAICDIAEQGAGFAASLIVGVDRGLA